MALFDGDNERIGTLLGFDDGFSVSATIYTTDGYLIRLNTLTGRIVPAEVVYFATADCSGQAYVNSFIGPDISWAMRGGAILRDSQILDKLARIDWKPQFFDGPSVFAGNQCWRSDNCGGAPQVCGTSYDYLPVSYIDNSQYGIKPIDGSGEAGFLPPITGKVEASGEVIFCDGFECSQQ
jgi:hypothetical protein